MRLLDDLKTRLQLSAFAAQARLSPLMAMILGALATATAIAGLFAAYALIAPQGEGPETGVPDWKAPTLNIVELDPPKPDSAYEQALSRPIFAKNRKPTVKTASHATDADKVDAGPPSGLTVGAIVRNKGVTQAFIVSPDSPEGDWKKVGDMVDSWTISSIAPTELVLTSGERAAKVKLFEQPQPDQPPAPAQPVGSAPPPPGGPPPGASLPADNAPPPPGGAGPP